MAIYRFKSKEIRKIASLTIQNVIARISYMVVVPQLTFASFVDPGTVFFVPNSITLHFACCVGFEIIQGPVRRRYCSDNYVNMISPHVDGIKIPIPMSTDLVYGLVHRETLL